MNEANHNQYNSNALVGILVAGTGVGSMVALTGGIESLALGDDCQWIFP
jgi:ribose 5-phosphate isomerase RpiB